MIKIMDGTAITGNYEWEKFDFAVMENWGLHLTVPGVHTLEGDFHIQVANETADDNFWNDIDFVVGSTLETTVAITSGTNFSAFIDIVSGAKWIRVKYVGTGAGSPEGLLSRKE